MNPEDAANLDEKERSDMGKTYELPPPIIEWMKCEYCGKRVTYLINGQCMDCLQKRTS